MTMTEFLTAHAVIDERAAHGPRDTCELFRTHGMSAEDFAALVARGNHYRIGVPSAPPTLRRLLPGDRFNAGGDAWQVIAGYGHSPEHASLFAAARGVLVSGDMLLPKISTNVSVWPSDPDGDPLGRFLDSLTAFEDAAAPMRSCSRRMACRFAASHCGSPSCARIMTRGWPSSWRRSPRRGLRCRPRRWCPILFRRPLDLQQRFFAMGEAIAHLNYLWRRDRVRRTLADDGTLRFAA